MSYYITSEVFVSSFLRALFALLYRHGACGTALLDFFLVIGGSNSLGTPRNINPALRHHPSLTAVPETFE